MARFERSCGFVLFHQEGEGAREYLLLHYPTGHWDFAKGHVEKGEEDLATALREAREETGFDRIEVESGFRHMFEYFYHHRSTTVKKQVTWFLGRVPHKTVTLSHEHQGFVWLPYREALERITYSNAKELLQKAERHLTGRGARKWFSDDPRTGARDSKARP